MARAPRRRALTEQDRSTWALYVQLIRPLDGVEKPPAPPEVPMVSAPQPPAPAMRPAPVVKRLGPLSVGQHPPGVDRGTWERFRTGKLPAQRTLDLHGRTAARAHGALLEFLHGAHGDGVRCVEVITGQGRTGRGSSEAGGVIRREFPLWLNEPALRSRVLAAAHPHALNPGSVRLLLRRVRDGAR